MIDGGHVAQPEVHAAVIGRRIATAAEHVAPLADAT